MRACALDRKKCENACWYAQRPQSRPRLCASRLMSTSTAPASLTFHRMRTQAKSLIKSLSRFSDTDVEEMCQIVQRFKASS